MRINILLIICMIICFYPAGVKANAVSGLYNIPHHSVKFEKQNNFSILPVGWSKDGKAAFLIVSKDQRTMSLLIFDAVDDKVLWKSPLYSLENKSMGTIWGDNAGQFSEKLSSSSIIPDENPQYGSPFFSSGDDDFKLFSEETSLPGNRVLSSVSLKIESKLRGFKTLYNYVHDDTSGQSLMDFHVLGYFQSPWEKRVAVLSAEDLLSDGGSERIELKFSGAHLSIGYRREVSSETQLIDYILSGQYYNARTILGRGVDPNVTVSSGDALILMAARQNNWDLVFLLIEYNAAIAVVDSRKRTLLHYGAVNGNIDIVRKLLSIGINKNFKDAEGESALSLARKNGHIDVVGLLD